MKKAYVKPQYFAEEFVAESSYIAGCGASVYSSYEISLGMDVCLGTSGDEGHFIGGSDNLEKVNIKNTALGETWHYNANGTSYTNWEYAQVGTTAEEQKATIFMTRECDFWWDPDTGNDGYVYVWDSTDVAARQNKYSGAKTAWGFFKFFTGANPNEGQHSVAFKGTQVPQS